MAPKKSAAGKVKVRRIGSPIRRDGSQRATLMGLGLKRANQVVELEDTPSIQGMIRKVHHLVEIVK
ncbi:LSU ribosomal protein L30p [alpha proteobacterium U9-1i]|nr:LSU ribosomal protein L30p [alpha proteobacterium U9-1i]